MRKDIYLLYAAQAGCHGPPGSIESCWPVQFRRTALGFPTIILQDGVTELTKKMYLAEDPTDCFVENLRSPSNVTDYDKFQIVVRQGIGSPEGDGSIAAFSDGRALQTRLQSLHILGIRKQTLHIPPSVIANPQKLGRIYESETGTTYLQINTIYKGILLKGCL